MTPAHVEPFHGTKPLTPSSAEMNWADTIMSKLQGSCPSGIDTALSGASNASLIELAEAYAEAQVPNWDGYDAQPIEETTYKYAQRFICTFPRMFPLPDVAAEPDGYICFDWYDTPDYQFSISIDKHGRFHYSGLFGDSKVYGEERNLGIFPDLFLAYIRRVYGNA